MIPRRSRIAMAAYFFVSGFGFASFASRIPSLQQKLQLNEAQMGTALFAMPLGLICTLPITGILLNKYSSRYVLISGCITYNLFLCSLGFVNNSWQLMSVLFLFGASRNLMNISMNAQSMGVQKLYTKSIITTFHGIWSISGFVGGALGGLMIGKDISLAHHFQITGFICVSTVLYFFRDTIKNDARKVENDGKQKRVLLHLPDKAILKLGLVAFACQSCEGIMFDWSGIYFHKVVHAPKHLITTGYVAFMCAAAIARFTGDWFVNQSGIKRVLQVCSGFAIAGFVIAVLFPYLIPATIGFVFVGIGISCIVPLIMTLAAKTSSQSPGVAIASVSTVSYFGFLFGPPVIGYVAQAANLQWSFGLGIIASIAMLLLVTYRVKVE